MKTYIDNVLEEFVREIPNEVWHQVGMGNCEDFRQEIIKRFNPFIKKLLDQQKEELIEKLEGEKKELEHDDCVVGYEYCECLEWEKHNQAFDRAIEIIKESK